MIRSPVCYAARNPKLLGIPSFAIYRRILLSFLGRVGRERGNGRTTQVCACSLQSLLPPPPPPLAPPTGAEKEGETEKCREFRATSTQKCLNWSQTRERERERVGAGKSRARKVNPKREKKGEKFPFFTLNGAARPRRRTVFSRLISGCTWTPPGAARGARRGRYAAAAGPARGRHRPP